MSAVTRASDELLLGEWACLGLLCAAPAHGFALSVRLRPDGDVGRVWSLTRPLVYRSIEQLTDRELIKATGQEPGIAGGNRTILAPTTGGRKQFAAWLSTPVPHLRDLRSELLLKLVLAGICEIDTSPLVAAQRNRVAELSDALAVEVAASPDDVVTLWRFEASKAALHFLDTIGSR
jgi:DNA-binding PadR family transcriptional regulator